MNSKFQIASIFASLFASASLSLAHGPVIPLTQSGGSLVTNLLDLDDDAATNYTPAGATRTFPTIPMFQRTAATATGDNGWYGQIEATQPSDGADTTFLGPGFAYGAGGFDSTYAFKVTFASPALVWQADGSAAGGSFVPTGGEVIQGNRGSFGSFANTGRSDGVYTGTGISTGRVGTAVNAHSQVRWRLLGSEGSPVPSATNVIDDGLYLASLQVTAYETTLSGSTVVFGSPVSTLSTSSTFYILFNKNESGLITTADVANAQAAVASLVPEPTSLAVLGLAGAALLGRRRRA